MVKIVDTALCNKSTDNDIKHKQLTVFKNLVLICRHVYRQTHLSIICNSNRETIQYGYVHTIGINQLLVYQVYAITQTALCCKIHQVIL